MDFYRLAKLFINLKSPRVKIASLLGAHLLGARYVGVFLDPVLSCNLRCRMCYFSDPARRPKPTAPMTRERISLLAEKIFPRALKLQIGCGAEPSTYKDLPFLIRAAKSAGVPYVEMTSNCQLFDSASRLQPLIDAGLGGITLSLHGTTRQTYEYLMQGASFDKLLGTIEAIKEARRHNPAFRLRINYTFNNLNIGELQGLWQLFDGLKIDVLQIRPIQKLGETAYADFDLHKIHAAYDTLILPAIEHCQASGIIFIGPSRNNLLAVDYGYSPTEALIEDLTYYSISPTYCYKGDFDLQRDTFRSYHRRARSVRRMLGCIFAKGISASHSEAIDITKKANYKIK